MATDRYNTYKNNACISGLVEAISDKLSKSDKTELLKDIASRVDQKRIDGIADEDMALRNVFQDLFNEHADNKKIQIANELRKALLVNKKVDFIKSNFKDPKDFAKGVKASVSGIVSDRKGARGVSTQLKQKTYVGDYLGKMKYALKEKGVLDDFTQKLHGADLAQELYSAGSTKNERARLMAEAITPIYDQIRIELNKLGIPVADAQDFIASFHRDPEKMLHTHDTLAERIAYRKNNIFNYDNERELAYKRWKDTELQLINHDKTFKNGTIDVDEFMRSAFDNQTVYNPIKRNAKLEDIRTFGALGVKGGASRKIFYKDGYNFYKANTIYGYGDFFDMIENTIDKGARMQALAEDWSTSPYQVFNSVLDILQKDKTVKSNEKMINAINKQRLLFDELTGRAAIPVNNTTNNITNSIVAYQSITRLGSSIAPAFNDLVAYAAAQAKDFNKNSLEAGYDALSNFFRSMNTNATKERYDIIGHWAKTLTGQITSRFSTLDGATGFQTKLLQKFFSLNLLHWQDKMLSSGIIEDTARGLFQESKNSFDELTPSVKKMLEQYGVTDKEWDVMRKNPTIASDNRKFITPDDALSNYSKETIAGLLNKNVKDLTKPEYDDARTNIRRKLIALMSDRSSFVYLSRDIAETSALRFGSRPGTLAGSMIKLLTQFHSWAFANTRRVLGRTLSGVLEAQGFKPKVNALKNAMPQLGLLIAGNMITGYISQTAINLAEGREPPDITKVSTWAKSSLGAFGIAGELLGSLAGQQTFGDSPLFDQTGAFFNNADKALKIVQSPIKGHFASKLAFNFAKGNIPGVNLIYTRLALNYFILWGLQEKLFPGSLEEQQRQLTKHDEPQYFVNPLSAVGV